MRTIYANIFMMNKFVNEHWATIMLINSIW